MLVILLVVLLCSCENGGGSTIARGDFDLVLSAELPEMQVIDDSSNLSSKAATQYTVKIKWALGDKLSVINVTTGKILGGNLTADVSGTVTTFSGSLNGTINAGDRIMYFYPGQSNAAEEDFTGAEIDFSSQKGTMSGVPISCYSVVTADGATFSKMSVTFQFLMSYIMIGLSDIPASATVKAATLTNVTNSFNFALNANRTGYVITPQTGNIVLFPASAASASGNKTVYAALPASESMTRFVVLETGTSTFSAPFTSAKIGNGSAYNTNVSGFLIDDLNIVDDSMREYCLNHFDANGDGKLSMVEVAGVKEFPDQSMYPIPTDVKEFGELQYFYGLTEMPSFKNCTTLQTITIPKSIKLIPSESFYGCTTLVKVILKPTVPPVLGQNVFVGQAGELLLIVADDYVADYQVADGWKDYFNNFRTESSQGDTNVDIEIEDEDSMDNERVEITIE
ncbi:MAG: leucine-rich repeat protein [Bacteroidales bacterium]|nr:leucine-rich repeat protein [Bacteroidales bacterium]